MLANINPALLLESGILGGPDIVYHALEDGPIAHQSINGSYSSVAPITDPNDNPHPFTVPNEHPDAILFHSSPVNEIGSSPTHSHCHSVPPSGDGIESPPSLCPDKGEIPPACGLITPEEDLLPDALLLQRGVLETVVCSDMQDVRCPRAAEPMEYGHNVLDLTGGSERV